MSGFTRKAEAIFRSKIVDIQEYENIHSVHERELGVDGIRQAGTRSAELDWAHPK